MRWVIFALFIVPVVEVMLFVTIGGKIGVLSTLAIVLLTAAFGSWLLTTHGRGLRQNFQNEMQTRGFPARSIFDGLCLGAAALLLMTPGFFTDAIGLLLFVSPVRKMLFRILSQRVEHHGFMHWQSDKAMDGQWSSSSGGPIIEGETDHRSEAPSDPQK